MLAIANLPFFRDDRPLFSGLKNEIDPGDWVKVTEGVNSAGKTSLVRTRIPGRSGASALCVSAGATIIASCFVSSIRRALEQVGLLGYEDRAYGGLSAGQRRRIALARLWLTPATLWILDEPLTALNLQEAKALTRQIKRHFTTGRMVDYDHSSTVAAISVPGG